MPARISNDAKSDSLEGEDSACLEAGADCSDCLLEAVCGVLSVVVWAGG